MDTAHKQIIENPMQSKIELSLTLHVLHFIWFLVFKCLKCDLPLA